MREARRAPGANRPVWRYHSLANSSAVALALRSLLEADRLRADYRSSARVHLALRVRRSGAATYASWRQQPGFASRGTHTDQSLHE
jgi:hypothetical protein